MSDKYASHDHAFAEGFKAGAAAGEQGAPEPLTRSDVEKMSADEINARWDEVSTVLTEDQR